MRRKLTMLGIPLMIVLAVAAYIAYAPLRERRLVALLAAGDEEAAQSIQQMFENRLPEDARRARLLKRIADDFATFQPAGQLASLRFAEQPSPEATCLVRAALSAADPAVRSRAATLAALPAANLFAEVLPLLADPIADVRRAALKAIAGNRGAAPDEVLMPLLHDADGELRARAEAILRGRGLNDKDIHLSRLVNDPSPLKRLEVIRLLPADAEMDPDVWLQKLCSDPSPAVRANAACAAMDPTSPLGVNFTERVREMARRDPDGTVRQIADYLLKSQPK